MEAERSLKSCGTVMYTIWKFSVSRVCLLAGWLVSCLLVVGERSLEIAEKARPGSRATSSWVLFNAARAE